MTGLTTAPDGLFSTSAIFGFLVTILLLTGISWLLVNFWGIPFRIGALPEVTVVTLRSPTGAVTNGA